MRPSQGFPISGLVLGNETEGIPVCNEAHGTYRLDLRPELSSQFNLPVEEMMVPGRVRFQEQHRIIQQEIAVRRKNTNRGLWGIGPTCRC